MGRGLPPPDVIAEQREVKSWPSPETSDLVVRDKARHIIAVKTLANACLLSYCLLDAVIKGT